MSNQSDDALHLSVDQLAAHVERRLHGAEREAVVSHLVECGECRREYIDTGEVVGTARRKWIAVRTGIGLAVAAAAVFAVMPRTFRPPATTVARDVSTQRTASLPDVSPPVRLAAPADGERLTGDNLRLSWHRDGNEALYRVTVQTEAGAVVWKTETHDTAATLPAAVRLARGVTYYWIVDALDADGRSARSSRSAFIR